MTISPDSEMFDPNAPEFGEKRAKEELISDLEKIGGTIEDADQVIKDLNHGSVSTGETETHYYNVVWGTNGRYWVTPHPKTEVKH